MQQMEGRKMLTFPNNLHDDAVDPIDLGIEIAKTVPFEPRDYVELAAGAGSATYQEDDLLFCAEPLRQNREYDFVRGWLMGTKDGLRALHRFLRENPAVNQLEVSRAQFIHSKPDRSTGKFH
jgi:hypothetical protein